MVKSTEAKFSTLLFMLISFVLFCCLAGCGNKGDEPVPCTGTGCTPTVNAASLDLLASSQALNSSGTPTVTLTAIVKDSSNRVLAGQPVSFSASSGSLSGMSTITDASGQATATLSTVGDKSNRIINVTANCGSISNANYVQVVGTTIEVSGQDSIANGSNATYTITLKDSASAGIGSQTVNINSQHNTLDKTTLTTNNNGQGTVKLTANSGGGADTLTATAMGAIGQKTVTVNSASIDFAFTTPLPNTEIPISTLKDVTIHYAISGVPQAGIPVSFAASRGTFTGPNPATTDALGNATIQISSTNVGRTTISADVTAGPSAQLNVEFVATTPATMTLQADPSAISTNIGSSTTQRSTLTATVRDAQNNLVKNQKINFSIITDPSGGDLSPATAITNSAGRATVVFIAGPSDSGTNGVNIQAIIQGTSITQTTTLTVGGIALYISVGTGPKITQLDDQTYQKNYDVLVTDAAGHPVTSADVTAVVKPIAYVKGHVEDDGTQWLFIDTLASTHNTSLYSDPVIDGSGFPYCLNEDLQYWNDAAHTSYLLNGTRDPGEDYNGNNKLDPGTIAGVTPGSKKTDSNGSATFGIIYTKSYAVWTFVRLDVTVTAGGTEGRASTTFQLPFLKDDYPHEVSKKIWPPDSPFGNSTTCADAL